MRVINERNFVLCHALWFVLLYIVCFQVASTNSRTSTLWKLNTKTGKITSYPKATEVSDPQRCYINVIAVVIELLFDTGIEADSRW